jgi:hypothetical protein
MDSFNTPADFIKEVYATEISTHRPKWMVMVINPQLMQRLTRPEGWRVVDLPLPGCSTSDASMHFIQIGQTNMCTTYTGCVGYVVNSMIEFAIGAPVNFMLSEVVPHTRFQGGLDNMYTVKSSKSRFLHL